MRNWWHHLNRESLLRKYNKSISAWYIIIRKLLSSFAIYKTFSNQNLHKVTLKQASILEPIFRRYLCLHLDESAGVMGGLFSWLRLEHILSSRVMSRLSWNCKSTFGKNLNTQGVPRRVKNVIFSDNAFSSKVFVLLGMFHFIGLRTVFESGTTWTGECGFGSCLCTSDNQTTTALWFVFQVGSREREAQLYLKLMENYFTLL